MQSSTKEPARVLFVNRSYWPDAEATGQLLTELCQDLVSEFEVDVIAGQPKTNTDRDEFLKYGFQQHQGVRIRRVWHTHFKKASSLGRILYYLSFFLTATLAAIRARRPDVIVVETDPPLLCFLGLLTRWWHKTRLVIYLQDIYPDLAIAIGKLPKNRLTAVMRRLFFAAYRRADRVVVLSADMRAVLIGSAVPAEKIETIPNWVDTTNLRPVGRDNPFRSLHQLNGQFVVMYSGNIGLTQPLDELLDAAERLRDREDILFLLVGNGASRTRLESQVARDDLRNVRFLEYQSKSALSNSLSAADLHFVPLDPRVNQYLMPSKLYGILASGTPLLAMTASDTELARITEREGVGFVIPMRDSQALAETVRSCADRMTQLESMGRRARNLAEQQFDRKISTARFAELLNEIVFQQSRGGKNASRHAGDTAEAADQIAPA